MNSLRGFAKAMFATADLFLVPPTGPRILIYHQVGARSGRQMDVEIADFVAQLDWLENNRDVVPLEAALGSWQTMGSDNLVVLTFDDGYQDLFQTVFPMMKERRLPFTVYVTTSYLERGSDDNGFEMLSWDQVSEMIDSGLLTVGAHTHTHRDLRTASSDELLREFESSDELINDRLGFYPDHFAYPWGYWSDAADALVRGRYSSAVLGAPPVRKPAGYDPYLVHRFPVQLSDGSLWFKARIRRGLLVEEAVRRGLRGYRGP